MKKIVVASFVALVLLSSAVWAQRGGRGGGGGGSDRGAAPAGGAPTLLTAYDSDTYGLKFPAPPELSLFTPEQPGRFRRLFTERQIVYMVDLMGAAAAVSVKYLPKATEADVATYRNTVDSNPPQARLPEYKKVSVGTIKIGTAHDKDAIEYVYTAKENDGKTVTRQVVFVHKGNGFIFTCVAPEKDYSKVNKKSFEQLFGSIEFK